MAASGPYVGKQRNSFFACEDLNAAGLYCGAACRKQTISWTGINITGYSNLSFTVMVAANNGDFVNPGPWENATFPSTHTDYLYIDYRIDGGPYINLLGFGSDGAGTKRIRQDINFLIDSIGEGSYLTKTFQDFSAPIGGTGSTLELRAKFLTEDPAEEFALDSLRILGTVLPFNNLQLNAQIQGQQIDLSWNGELATAPDYFVVRRSAHGDVFTELATVQASGAANYTWVDQSPLGGTSYYEVTAFDAVGNTIATEGRWVTRTDGSVGYFVTTMSEGILNVGITGEVVAGSVLNVVNPLGQVVQSFPVETAGAFQFDITNLESGFYWVTLTGAGRTREAVFLQK